MARFSSEIRTQVATRAKQKCEYCHSPQQYAISSFSIEHVMPLSKGGTSEIGNLALSCQQCNNHKYNVIEALDPVSNEIYKLFSPRVDAWEQHFAWDYQFIRLVGITGTGRATVRRMNLNRESLLNLRQLLVFHQLHP